MIRKLDVNDREQFIAFTACVPIQSIISMEVETFTGSGLEGICWEFLKYVYNRDKDENRSPSWITYTMIYKDSISVDGLVSDFDELQKCGVHSTSNAITIFYDEDRFTSV